jgi:hypothetical protein
MNIIEKLQILHHQATEEKSHYYVGTVALDAAHEIVRLQESLNDALRCFGDLPISPKFQPAMPFDLWLAEVRLIMKLAGWSAKAIWSLHDSAWKEYYHSGMSPAQAIEEEVVAAV